MWAMSTSTLVSEHLAIIASRRPIRQRPLQKIQSRWSKRFKPGLTSDWICQTPSCLGSASLPKKSRQHAPALGAILSARRSIPYDLGRLKRRSSASTMGDSPACYGLSQDPYLHEWRLSKQGYHKEKEMGTVAVQTQCCLQQRDESDEEASQEEKVQLLEPVHWRSG